MKIIIIITLGGCEKKLMSVKCSEQDLEHHMSYISNSYYWNLPNSPLVKTSSTLPIQGMHVQSLVGELRSLMPHSEAKNASYYSSWCREWETSWEAMQRWGIPSPCLLACELGVLTPFPGDLMLEQGKQRLGRYSWLYQRLWKPVRVTVLCPATAGAILGRGIL